MHSQWNQSWAANAVRQIFKVVSVAGNTITIDEPIRIDYKASLSPQIRTQVFVEYAGIERLHLKRQDPGDAFMIEFRNVACSWIREVESEYASKSHVIMIAGYRCEIRDSYFHHAYDYGGGGHGYSTIFTVVNTGSTTAIGSLILTDQLGNPLFATITERTSSPQSAPTGQVSDAEGSSFSITIPTGATKILTLAPN